MIVRLVSSLAGVASGLGASQFPAFPQAYLQRLGGHVDALRQVVAEFDADAAALGLERSAALVQLAQGGEMGAQRAETMAATIDRYTHLSQDLRVLSGLNPVERFLHLARFSDGEIARATFGEFEPGLALSTDALMIGLSCAVGGRLLVRVLLGGTRRVFAWG